MKKPKIYSSGHDIVEWFEVEGLTQRQVREAYSEMIDALEFTLTELPDFVLNTETEVVTKIKQALKKAGCEL